MIKSAVKHVAGWADRFGPPSVGVTVLIYHRVGGGTSSEVDLDPTTFERQLEHLVEHHRVLTLADALAELGDGESDEPAVVLTFDDGTADFTDVAVPLLERHQVPATLYVATRFVDEQVEFPWGAPPTSWAALRDALSTGVVTVGSHTHTHRLFHRLSGPEAAADLDRSIDLIGEHLGVTADDFAYPKAVVPCPAAEIEVRRRFRSAALAGGRVNRAGAADPLRLWRTPVQASDDFGIFAARAAGGLRLEGELRAAAARVRYRRSER